MTVPVGAVKIDLAPGLLVLDAARHRHVLAADAAEEGGQAPVVVLAPLLVRVVVALGAGHTQAEEHLGGVVDELLAASAAPCTTPSAGSAISSPVAARMSRTNWSYGLSLAIASRIQLWKAKVPWARFGLVVARLTRRMSAHLLAK